MVLEQRKRDKISAIVYPSNCAGCGETLNIGETICPICEKLLMRVGENICKKCGRDKVSCKCKEHSLHFERSISPFYYQGIARECVVRFKFRGIMQAGEYLAAEMAKTFVKEYSDIKFDLIAAVPMSKSEIRKRNFDHTAFLAKKLNTSLEITYEKSALKKIFETKSQHELSYIYRTGNVFGVFDANPKLVEGKVILLIDDVMTTGSTLNECAKMLKLAGALRVYCLTAANVIDKYL